MKRIVFWVVLAAILVIPAIVLAGFAFVEISLTPDQLTLLKEKPTIVVDINLTESQILRIKYKFPNCTVTVASCRFIHVFDTDKILLVFKSNKLLSIAH